MKISYDKILHTAKRWCYDFWDCNCMWLNLGWLDRNKRTFDMLAPFLIRLHLDIVTIDDIQPTWEIVRQRNAITMENSSIPPYSLLFSSVWMVLNRHLLAHVKYAIRIVRCFWHDITLQSTFAVHTYTYIYTEYVNIAKCD